MSDDFNLDDFNFEDMDLSALEAELNSIELEDIDLSGEPGVAHLDTSVEPIKNPLHKTVMIVDDDAGTLRNIKSLLEGKYNVAVANNGVKALEVMAMEQPDIVLLDYEMPRMNGPEMMRALRMKPEFADIPIIFLTGVNDRAQITAALALHPDGYLLKPVNREKLLTTIGDVLSKK